MTRRRALIPVLLGGTVFAVYALGACRTIYVGDSGELVAAAATLGFPTPAVTRSTSFSASCGRPSCRWARWHCA